MNYFIEYKKAKLALLKLLCQFYDIRLNKEKTKKLNLNYNESDKPNDLDSIHFIYHYYDPEALYVWKKLEIKKDILPIHEVWDLMDKLKYEEKKNIDYYRESLELKIICIYLTERNYKYSISEEEAIKNKIEYNEMDEYNGKIEGCDHYFEGAGEAVWNLFGLEQSFIPLSKFNKIKDNLENKLLKLDMRVNK